MIETLLFSKPFSFLACPPIAELKEAIDALNTLPGHSRWLKEEDAIRREHVPAFVEQSRQALEALVPGRSLMVDSLADRIRHTPRVLQELREHGPDVAAAAHSYFYWRYSADVLGRAQGIPRSALERQFGRVAARDGSHKIIWGCPCCDNPARYQVDGLLANQRPARQGGFALECDHCGHQERVYAGFLHYGRLQCQCAACKSYVGVLAYDMARAARKLSENLEKYAWSQAAETLAEIQEYKDESLQMLQRRASPSRNAASFALEVASGRHQSMLAILASLDPGLEGCIEKNPRAWALLCELLREGVVDNEYLIYEEADRERVALQLSLLEEPSSQGQGLPQKNLETLLQGYQPASRESFVAWLKASSQLKLFTGKFCTAVEVTWRPNAQRCKLVASSQDDHLRELPHDAALRAATAFVPPSKQPPHTDAEIEAVTLLRSLGYIVVAPAVIEAHGYSKLEESTPLNR
ncbi:hypothetical protein [Cupriavidus sp. CuC1]|uniref:hypothetical protein n=1 Tax=Cupriavidus sp. CuC1 TaxID=3373131 RepID=UPI0037D18C95